MRWSEITESKDSLILPTIDVGDEVLVGKFKNRKATVKGFTTDDHNQPVLKTNKGDQKLFKPRISKLMTAEGEVVSLANYKSKAERLKPPGKFSDFRVNDWIRLQGSNPRTGQIIEYIASGVDRDFFKVRFLDGEVKSLSNVNLWRTVAPKRTAESQELLVDDQLPYETVAPLKEAPMFVKHFQQTFDEYRGTGRYIDRGDFKAVPHMICNTGDAHAVGTRDWTKVTCERCLLRKPKVVKPPTADEVLDLL